MKSSDTILRETFLTYRSNSVKRNIIVAGKILKCLVLIWGCFAFACSLKGAPNQDIKFTHIGIEQGLSHSTINGITQSDDGFLWVATSEGLNRFDGYSFKVFRPDSLDYEIRDVMADNDGNIWTATLSSVFKYSKEKGRFLEYRLEGVTEVNKLYAFEDKIYAATSHGFFILNPDTGIFELNDLFKGSEIQCLARQGDILYLGTWGDGVYSIDNNTVNEIPGTSNLKINMILPLNNDIFIATEGNGLLLYNKATNTTTGLLQDVNANFVRTLLNDSKGRLWIGTFTGLYILDNDRKTFQHLNSSNEEGALNHNSVRRFFTDNQGGIWVGTFFGGLNYYHPLQNQFSNIRKTSGSQSLNDNVIGILKERANGEIWIATNMGGLNIFDTKTGKYSHITGADGIGSNDIKAVYFDEEKGRVFIGSNNGPLAVADITSKKIVDRNNNIRDVYDIIPSFRENHLWIASINGLLLYDPDTKEVKDKYLPDGKEASRELLRSEDGRLWVASEYGLTVYNENNGNLEVDHSVPKLKTNINQIFQSKLNKDLWFATFSGLYHLPEGSKEFKKSGTEEGLPGNIVYAVTEDATGNIWISTNHGLAYLHPEKGIINSFTSKDGIQGNQFNPKSVLMSGNGRMYFGGTNGITYFNPSTFEKNNYSPTPYIGSLRLFNQEVTPGDETGLLTKNINDTKKVTFNNDQTSFTLEFGVSNFTALTHNTFKYMLDGLDKQWTIAPEGVRSVVYSNLPAGKYTFRLLSANNDGIWSDKEKTLEIEILAHWYELWWVNALAFGFILILIFFATRYYWIRKEREKKEAVLRDLDKMKLSFFVNMSHELRTPLTLMLLPINELIERGGDPVTMKKYSLIRNNTLRIKNIVDQILQYQKVEMGILKLKVKAVDINNFMQGVLEPYRVYAERKKIRMIFNSDIVKKEIFLDPNYIDHIVTNLVANAFKYTSPHGTVEINITEKNDNLIIKISDTGCGISPEKQRLIFNPFYQVNNLAEGYGIGLALVKRLVENHHGKITVESEPGKGSCFIVTLPCKSSDYDQAEKGEEHYSPEVRNSAADADALIPETETESESEEPGDNTRKTILIVDDNPEILKYISESFSTDFNVVTALNGAQAIECLSSDNIDMVITDVMMPDVDGVQLCRAIKRNLRTSHIPVIMLSGKGEIADKLAGVNVGAEDYVEKPFSMKLLLGKVKNILRMRDSVISHYINSKTEIDPVKLTQSPLDEEFLKKAIKVMEENIDNSDFSTDEFAREMFMSRSNLHLKMKAITGEATNDFIRRTRMTKAAELLKTQNYTVAEVSYMVGYKTPSYFATAFKSFFGYSPSSLLAQ